MTAVIGPEAGCGPSEQAFSEGRPPDSIGQIPDVDSLASAEDTSVLGEAVVTDAHATTEETALMPTTPAPSFPKGSIILVGNQTAIDAYKGISPSGEQSAGGEGA